MLAQVHCAVVKPRRKAAAAVDAGVGERVGSLRDGPYAERRPVVTPRRRLITIADIEHD